MKFLNNSKQGGFSIVELMIASIIGLLLTYALVSIYVAQTQIYKTTNSQNLIQNAENAIVNLLTPIIRSAGFFGCAASSTIISNLNGGGTSPLSTIATAPTMIIGYNGSTASSFSVGTNPANETNSSSWTPALDSTLVGNVQKFSDVVVILSGAMASAPSTISTITTGSNSFTLQSNNSGILAGQLASVSDCVSTTIFQASAVSGTSITHKTSSGYYGNTSDAFTVPYLPGAQFMPVQQNAFFIGQGQGGQSTLMRGVFSGSSWTFQPLVPGVEAMEVLYGVGANSLITQYVSADAVTNWANVYAVRIGFLIAGQSASGVRGATSFTVLNSKVNVPADNRLRHVLEVNIGLRNAAL